MDIDKVRALTDQELGSELSTQRRHLYDLRFQLATRQLTDHSQLTQARRTVARVLTVMSARDPQDTLGHGATPIPTRYLGFTIWRRRPGVHYSWTAYGRRVSGSR